LSRLRTLGRYVRNKRAAEVIRASGLLDENFYRGQVSEWQGPCWEHYLLYGVREGRDPSPLFDASFYLSQHPEAAENPLVHYVTTGARLGYDPHPLFDTDFYAKAYLRDSDENPLAHYVQKGAFAGHAPHPLFDAGYYLRTNPDVAAARVDPLVHYLQNGWQENRNPHPLFDVGFYLRQHAGDEPLTHYLLSGGFAGLDPHPLFDSSYYLEQNPDVAAAKVNPLLHYLANGAREMRNPHPLFITSFYVGQNRHVAASGVEPLAHFLEFGGQDGRDPHPLFDSSYYLEQNLDVATAGTNPLVHYVLSDSEAKRNPHPLFDIAHYLRRNPDARGCDPLLHYAEHGTEDGRDPHPLFHTSYYLKQDPDIARSRELPLIHYLRVGFLEARNPNPLFDTAWYRGEHPELVETGINPLAHFVRSGGNPHPLFDSAYYLKRYPDALKAGVNPLAHYFSIGPEEDRDPHPMFDAVFYREHYPELSERALVHYLETGSQQGLDPHPDFDTAYYLDTYPEAKASGLNPLIHYVLFGREKGYLPNAWYRAYWEAPLPCGRGSVPGVDSTALKVIAFYLPQFHPIPENDQWWGEGFTEWRNVASAKPVFPGHHQPQLPANLGFYDLRVPEVMERQAELAAEYGVRGFCFYYYWFNGRKLLDLPLNRMLETGRPNFPFCLCWANENWTRSWDGLHNHILVEQRYSPEADRQLMRDLLPAFRDERYIRVNGAPLFLVYRVTELRDPAATAERWREVCAQAGIPKIHLCAVMSLKMGDPREYGFDSAVEFPPQGRRHMVWPQSLPGVSEEFEGFMEDYVAMARHFMTKPPSEYPRYRGIIPGWDNTARRGKRAHIVVRSSPEMYEKWLRAIVERTIQESGEKAPLVFINAWNEWAEGAHLEPDQKYGLAYLEATRRALNDGVRAASRHGVEEIADVHSVS